MTQHAIETSINQWGNGLAVRINKVIAKAAGVTEGTQVRIIAQPGRILVETIDKEPTLAEMLAAFDRQRHRGEMMAFEPIGLEVI